MAKKPPFRIKKKQIGILISFVIGIALVFFYLFTINEKSIPKALLGTFIISIIIFWGIVSAISMVTKKVKT